MAHAIFDIPEIVRLICEKLDEPSLIKLLTVSRSFFDIAVSLVWEDVNHYKINRFTMGPDFNYPYNLSEEAAENLSFTHFLDRWSIYAPHVIRYSCEPYDDLFNWEWNLLPSTTSRSLLPSLQVFGFTAPSDLSTEYLSPIEFAELLGLHLGPSVTSVFHRLEDGSNCLYLPRAFELIKNVVQSCPNIHTLQLFSTYEPRGHTFAAGFIDQLRQLGKLRTLGLGPIAWESSVLAFLGSLPTLESLTIRGESSRPLQNSPEAFTSLSENYLALRHLGIMCYLDTTAITPQVSKIIPLARHITSLSLNIIINHFPVRPFNDEMWDFILSICQSSPNIQDLHIHCMEVLPTKTCPLLRPFPPDVCNALQQLPLRRVTFTTRHLKVLLDGFDLRQFVFALPNVEFLLLDIAKQRFSFEDLKLIARHMKKLQHLVVGLHPFHWPSEIVSGPDLSPSPSPLYLDSTFRALYLEDEGTKQIAKCLHKLWPNGVHCAVQCASKKYEGIWTRLNKALAQLRASEGLDEAIVMLGHTGEYITEDTTPVLRRHLEEMKRFRPPKDGFDFPYEGR